MCSLWKWDAIFLVFNKEFYMNSLLQSSIKLHSFNNIFHLITLFLILCIIIMLRFTLFTIYLIRCYETDFGDLMCGKGIGVEELPLKVQPGRQLPGCGGYLGCGLPGRG